LMFFNVIKVAQTSISRNRNFPQKIEKNPKKYHSLNPCCLYHCR
jgi:hypothetical protein